MTAQEAKALSEIRQGVTMDEIFQTIKRAAERGEKTVWIIKKQVTMGHTDELAELGYNFLFDDEGDLRIDW